MTPMSRPRIEQPGHYPFSTELPLRISDINYGGHLGNDRVLTLAQEARAAYLASIGSTELSIGNGAGLIMADAAIEYKAEAHHGDIIRISVSVMNLSRAGFDMVYLLEKTNGDAPVTVAVVRTGMVCFDYARKKVVSIPEPFRHAVSALG